MSHYTPIAAAKSTILILWAFLVLLIGGCGSGGGQATPQTNAGETTSNTPISEETVPSSTPNPTVAEGTTSSEGTAPSSASNRTVRLTPNQDSDVSGEATFKDVTVGVAGVDNDFRPGVEVDLEIQNLPAQPSNELLETHIHQGGTCSDDQASEELPIQYTLSPITIFANGTGASTTTVAGVSVDELFSGTAKYIDVHAEKVENETPPSISCADLS